MAPSHGAIVGSEPICFSPQLKEAFHRYKRPVWVSWRMDETYLHVKGEWRYLYRAVDTYGDIVDFLLTENRHKEAALRFLKKVIAGMGPPRRSRSTGVTPMKRLSRGITRNLVRHRNPPSQIPQQHRRTGSLGSETGHPSHA